MSTSQQPINPEDFIDDRQDEGICRVDRSMFTDPDLFNLEMEKIWESNWIFLAHESQLKNPNDYMSAWIGRQPIILLRNGEGEIKAFINACAHRGVTLARTERGNCTAFECPFHGWIFNMDGELATVARERTGGYPEHFKKEENGLTPVPRVDSYRGFIFASLSDDVLPLDEHLADAKVMIDMLVNQSPEGLEVLPGRSVYTFDGNWKMQAENGVDGYHVFATHANYVLTTENRRKIMEEKDPVKSMQVGGIGQKGVDAGFFNFGHGHVLLYSQFPNPEDRPSRVNFDQYKEMYGETYADYMTGYLRNLLLYPNVFLMDQMSSQIRIFRPISVDKTEITIYCIAPVGEKAEQRELRLRQYEDFFNASGMATPDDISEFAAAQEGALGTLAQWNELSRGLEFTVQGSNESAKKLGLNLESSASELTAEGIMIAQHNYWLKQLQEK